MAIRFTLTLVVEGGVEGGEAVTRAITAAVERDALAPETLGLTLAEGKAILAELQAAVVAEQAAAHEKMARPCPACGSARASDRNTGSSHARTRGSAGVSISGCADRVAGGAEAMTRSASRSRESAASNRVGSRAAAPRGVGGSGVRDSSGEPGSRQSCGTGEAWCSWSGAGRPHDPGGADGSGGNEWPDGIDCSDGIDGSNGGDGAPSARKASYIRPSSWRNCSIASKASSDR